MNMKNWKNFFRVHGHSAGGFTLVELIVVIAILAILAGVAIPAYSGYIKKAQNAGDETLLSAFNTAFAAACAMNGVDHIGLDTANVVVTKTAAENQVGYEFTVNVKTVEGFTADFETFYEGGVFKVYNDLFYNPTTGTFSQNDAKTYNFNGKEITLSAKDVAALAGKNAFSDRGSAALLGDVAVLENLLTTGMGEEVLDLVVESDEFHFAMGAYMGMTQGENESDEDYANRVADAIDELENPSSALYSGQIMYAASQAANATQEDVDKLFSGTVTGNITVKNEDGSINNEKTMANAALAYGMYTAYLQQNNLNAEEQNFSLVMNSDEFETYMQNEGKADLEAYMAAMNMISDNTSNTEVTADILANGIAGNTELENLMKEVMGK